MNDAEIKQPVWADERSYAPPSCKRRRPFQGHPRASLARAEKMMPKAREGPPRGYRPMCFGSVAVQDPDGRKVGTADATNGPAAGSAFGMRRLSLERKTRTAGAAARKGPGAYVVMGMQRDGPSARRSPILQSVAVFRRDGRHDGFDTAKPCRTLTERCLGVGRRIRYLIVFETESDRLGGLIGGENMMTRCGRP